MRKLTIMNRKLWLLTMVCFVTLRAYPQDLASLIPNGEKVETAAEEQEKRTKPLKKLLTELQARFQVSFNYDSELIRHTIVENKEVTGELESFLNGLLEQKELKCKKIAAKTYVIYPKQEAPESKKRSSNEGNALTLVSSNDQPTTLSGASEAAPEQAAASVKAIIVKGQVTDEKNEILPGVGVVLKGTVIGTSTDANGNYSISLMEGTGVLVFSYIGYISQEISINNRTTIDVTLLSDTKTLNELVVVGYQAQKRSDIVGAVTVVDTKEMKKTQAASVGELLQGRATGVTVTSSGAPGQTSSVKIRGTNSINGQDSPLYVIDGMFINDSNPDFNPNDVESLQVLKDAAATALYGSRGMNGVIIITTKRGKSGVPKIDYSTYVGVQNIAKRLPLMNAAQYRIVNNLAYTNNGETPQELTPGVDTDWQSAMFKQGLMTDHNLTLSGGSENANYMVSGNYFYQDGTIIGPSFKRYQLRMNTEIRKGIFKIGENIMLSRNNTVKVTGNPFVHIQRMLPTIPVYDPTTVSGYGYGASATLNNTFGSNPVALQQHYSNESNSSKVFGSVYVEAALTSYLSYKLNMGLDYSQYHDKYYERIGRISQNAPDAGPAFVNDNNGEYFNTLIENTLSFNKTFGKHAVSAFVGYTQQKDTYKYVNAHTEGINGEFWQQDYGTSSPQTQGRLSVRGLASILGSFNYTFNDKYLLQINARRDGSSVFREGNHYGTFPSASIGWRVSKEKFMENVSFITDLKLRASYGQVGSQAISPYRINPAIDYNLNYVLGNNVVGGGINRQLVNSDIRWEKKTTTNVGFDLGLLGNRILLSADYFVARTKDLLIEVPIPWTAGNTGADPIDNLASIQNKGIEVALTYQETKGKLKYNITGNITAVRNKVLGLVQASGNQPLYGWQQVVRLAVGEPISFYVLKTDGIFQNPTEVDNSSQKGQSPGDIRFVDTHKDGIINFDDRQNVGTPFPKFEYGLNLSASYSNFDFLVFFAGVSGNKIFNEGLFWTSRYDDNGAYRTDDNYWTVEGSSNTAPRPRHGDPTKNPVYQSDRWIEDGSYLRLKTLQVGYTFPTAFLNKLKGIANLRIYASAQNLFTLTKYRGYNPEVTGANINTQNSGNNSGSNQSLNRGVDNGNYPVSRLVSFGLQVGF
ncbi:MAG: TonB-dependent receptor [Bacteroidota bacterium]